MMEKDFERLDLRTLLDAYMKESKEFSVALEAGASWELLHVKRQRIRMISVLINKKYEEKHDAHRIRHKPPHGD